MSRKRRKQNPAIQCVGKWPYPTWRKADTQAMHSNRAHHGEVRLVAYPCPHCNFFHIGNVTPRAMSRYEGPRPDHRGDRRSTRVQIARDVEEGATVTRTEELAEAVRVALEVQYPGVRVRATEEYATDSTIVSATISLTAELPLVGEAQMNASAEEVAHMLGHGLDALLADSDENTAGDADMMIEDN